MTPGPRDLAPNLSDAELLAVRRHALDLTVPALPPSSAAAAKWTIEAAAVLADWLLTGRCDHTGVQSLAVDDLQHVPQQGEGVEAVELVATPLLVGDPGEYERGQALARDGAVGHVESPSVGRAPKVMEGEATGNGASPDTVA